MLEIYNEQIPRQQINHLCFTTREKNEILNESFF